MIFAFGLIALVSQAVLLEELSVLFRRNEIVIGIVLGAWLLGGGLGSAAYRLLPLSWCVNARLPERLLLAISVSLFVLVFAIRFVFGLFRFDAAPNLVVLALLAFILSLPVSFLSGLAFSVLSEMRSRAGGAGRVYLGEAIGALAGGVAVTFLFAEADSIEKTLVLVLIAASFLINRGRTASRKRLAVSILVPALFLPYVLKFSGPVVWASREIQFRSSELVTSRNSKFGNISVVRNGDQLTTYYAGEILYHAEAIAFEEDAWLPTLVCGARKSILVLGFAPPPLLEELGKHRPEKITVVLLDPVLADEMKRNAGGVPVEVLVSDPFRWSGVVAGTYDLVLVRRGLPLKISDNRFYSRSFYRKLKDALNDGGVVSFMLPYEENRFNPNTLDILKSVSRTLESCFRSVGFVPGSLFCMIASDRPVTVDRDRALNRLRAAGGGGKFVNEGYIKHYFAPNRLSRFRSLLKSGGDVPVNDLFSMRIYLNGLKRRIATDLGEAGVILALLLAGFAYLAGRNRARLRELLAADAHSLFMFCVGFAGMAGEIELLSFYQSVNGYVYHAYALLVAAFMAGTAFGAAIAVRLTVRARVLGPAATLIVLLWVWLIGMLYFFEPGWLCAGGSVTACVFVLNLVGGAGVGAVFGSESRIVEGSGVGTGATTAAKLYSFDLFGAAAAALVTPLVLVPAFGPTVAADVAFVALLGAAILTWRSRYAA